MVLKTLIVFYITLYLENTKGLSTAAEITSDSKLNTTELALKYGYMAEEHKVMTEDGYILTIFRMKGKQCEGKRPPVVLMHGLLMSSDAFLDAGPDEGLAYLLADDCQDLWIGNSRGNYYSRSHNSLNPDKKATFWDFDVYELGYYDVPATIDYVLDNTGEEKVNFIGHSQGSGIVFIMCSERPGYCDKINLMIGIAPGARQTNTRSVIFRTLSRTIANLEGILKAAGIHEIFGKEIRNILEAFCPLDKKTLRICETFLWLLDSAHPNSISEYTLKTLFGHFTAGTSLKNMAHYGQSMDIKEFQRYDYGKIKNLKMYNSINPPRYNLNAVTTPVVVIYGNNDGMVDTKDVLWLVSKLPNVVEAWLVPDPKWTHLDNIYSRNISKSIFPKVQEYLNKNSE